MNLRELVGVSLNSKHLEQIEHAEVAIDRVGALGKASDLGRALFHWGYAGQDKAALSAFHHLCRKARNRTRIFRHNREYKLLERVVAMVLYEWRHQACITCGGRGDITTDKLKIICAKCDGSGLHRFSDVWRLEFMKVDKETYRKWEKNIAMVTSCLASADAEATRVCGRELERR